jgi:hypothetical protein
MGREAFQFSTSAIRDACVTVTKRGSDNSWRPARYKTATRSTSRTEGVAE